MAVNEVRSVTILTSELLEVIYEKSSLNGKYTDSYEDRLTTDEEDWIKDRLKDAMLEAKAAMYAYNKTLVDPVTVSAVADPVYSFSVTTDGLLRNIEDVLKMYIRKFMTDFVLMEWYKTTKNELLFTETSSEYEYLRQSITPILHRRLSLIGKPAINQRSK